MWFWGGRNAKFASEPQRVWFERMREVVSALGGNQLGWRVALALIGKKVLSLNLGRPIEASSPVRIGPRGWI